MANDYTYMKGTHDKTKTIIEGYRKWLAKMPEMSLYDEFEIVRQEVLGNKKVEVSSKWLN